MKYEIRTKKITAVVHKARGQKYIKKYMHFDHTYMQLVMCYVKVIRIMWNRILSSLNPEMRREKNGSLDLIRIT